MNNYQTKLTEYKTSENNLKTFLPHKDLKIALGFPNVYSVGMASLGFQIVYNLFNTNKMCSAERFFLPDVITNKVLTIESQKNIKDFNAIGFSVSFELDYLNLLNILKIADLPLERQKRTSNHPIIFVGGAITLINPYTISNFVDFFIVGDGERIIDIVVDILDKKISKDEKLKLLSEVEGIFVPEYPKAIIKKHIVNDLDNYPGHSIISTPFAEFGDTVLFEIARGCGRGCYFCAAGHIQKPVRMRKPEFSKELNSENKDNEIPQYHNYGIVGAAVFDNPYSRKVCKNITDNNSRFSLSSIRLETLDNELLEIMKKANIKTVTIAPEAGSERLRTLIGKKCSNESIFKAIKIALDNEIRKFKLYFMIGLPSETHEDIIAISDLLISLATTYNKAHFSASIGCFVPKPRTRFEYEAMNTEKENKAKITLIKNTLNKIKNIDVGFESPRMAAVQGVLSRLNSEDGKNYLLYALEQGYPSANREFKDIINKALYEKHSENTNFIWKNIL